MTNEEIFAKMRLAIEDARFILNEIEDSIGVNMVDDLPGMGDAISMHGDTLDDLCHQAEIEDEEKD